MPWEPSVPDRRYVLIAACLVWGLILPLGCRQDTATPPTPPTPRIATDTPEAAARGLLALLQAHLDAVAKGDRPLARAYVARIIDELLAREKILDRYHRLAGELADEDHAALTTLVQNWASILMYYAGDIDSAHSTISALNDAQTGAIVEVFANGPGDTALIQVACLRAADETWRVTALELAPVTTAAQQSTRPAPPATQPQ